MHHWTTQEVIPTCVNHVYLISVNFWRFIIELFVHRAISYIYNFVIFSSICCCYRHSISLEINKIFWFRATTPRNWSGLQNQNHVSWTAPLPPVPAEQDEEHKRCDHGDGVFCSELVETHLQAEQMGSDKWRFCWCSSSIFTSPHWERQEVKVRRLLFQSLCWGDAASPRRPFTSSSLLHPSSPALHCITEGGGGGEVLIFHFFRFPDRETQLLIGWLDPPEHSSSSSVLVSIGSESASPFRLTGCYHL